METNVRKGCAGFSRGAGKVGLPGLLASPSSKIYTLTLYNKKNPRQIVSDFFGPTLIPNWLLPEDTWPHNEFYKGEDALYIWRPLCLKNRLPDYSIYYTIVNRVDYFERLINMRQDYSLKTSFSNWMIVEKALRQLQDRYQLLMLHMTLKNHFSDKDLLCDSPINALNMFGPHLHQEFTMESVPDLFVAVFNCGFWGDHIDLPWTEPRGSSSNPDQEMKLLVFLLTKLIPLACKSRAFTSSLFNAWFKKGFTSIFQCVLRMIIASLFGTYDHCKNIANFAVRQKLYKWFYLMPPNGEQLAQWISQNKYLIIYILREYLFWSIHQLPSLYEFLSQNYYLGSVIQNVFDAMDAVRLRFNDNLFLYVNCHSLVDDMDNSIYDHYLAEKAHYPYNCMLTSRKKWLLGQPWFGWTDHFLDAVNKANPDNWPRVMEMSFLDKMLSFFKELDVIYFHSGQVQWEDVSAEEKVLNSIFARNSSKAGFRASQIKYSFLTTVPFLVSEQSIEELENAEDLYKRETSRSNVKKTLERVLRRGARDYLILRHFFICIEKQNAIITYPLPREWTEKQLELYHQLYGTRPGEELPSQAGLYMICTNCRKIKSFSIPHESNPDLMKKNAKLRESTLCCDGIAINLDTGKLYCPASKVKTNNKKKNGGVDPNVEQSKNSNTTTTTDTTSNIQINSNSSGIQQQPTASIIDTNELVIEIDPPTVPVPTNTVNEAVTNLRAMEREQKKKAKHKREKRFADECPRTELTPVNMIGAMVKLKNMIVMLCPHCLSVMRFSRYCYENNGGVFSCGCLTYNKTTLPCTLCARETKEGVNRSYQLVYDDKSENPGIRKMIFCREPSCSWIAKWEQFLPLSTIEQSFKEGWYTSMDQSGDRMFTQRRSWNVFATSKLQMKLYRVELRKKKRADKLLAQLQKQQPQTSANDLLILP